MCVYVCGDGCGWIRGIGVERNGCMEVGGFGIGSDLGNWGGGWSVVDRVGQGLGVGLWRKRARLLP